MRGIRALPLLGPQAIRAALQSPHCCRDEGRVPLTAGKGQSKARCGWILSSAGQLPAPRVLLWLSVGWLWVPGRLVLSAAEDAVLTDTCTQHCTEQTQRLAGRHPVAWGCRTRGPELPSSLLFFLTGLQWQRFKAGSVAG